MVNNCTNKLMITERKCFLEYVTLSFAVEELMLMSVFEWRCELVDVSYALQKFSKIRLYMYIHTYLYVYM